MLKIVVVSPHRDDAAFSLSLAIRHWIDRSHRVSVLNCCTRSDYAPFADLTHVHPHDRVSFVSALRHREDEVWRRRFGSSALELVDLNLKDAPLRLRCPLDELSTRQIDSQDRVFAAIAKAIHAAGEAAIVVPLALGGHIDHRVVREAVLQVASGRRIAFYEDLPYAAWPDGTSHIEAHVGELQERLGLPLVPNAVLNEYTAEAAIAEKRRACLCYDSQIENNTAELIATFCSRYNGRERLWTTPGWNDGQPALNEPGTQ